MRKCTAFPKGIGGKTGLCNNCGCDWKNHVHIKHEFKNVKQTVVDPDQMLELKTLEASNTHSQKFSENIISQLENRIAEYKEEINVIQKAAAYFGYLLKTHSNSVFLFAFVYLTLKIFLTFLVV